jgi:hypothetical protein
MSFPFETNEEIAVEKPVRIPREYIIDFITGQFTNNIAEGADAVKIWIYNVLSTPRYRYSIFTWDYGNETEELISRNYTQEYLETEAKRLVEECLSVNECITGIDNFEVSQSTNKLSISFTTKTLFGEVTISV